MKKLRLDLGLLQRDVAGRIGVSAWTIANWEKGKTEPAVRFIPHILAFLGYDPRIEPPTKHRG